MDTADSATAREEMSSCGRIVTQEEFDALMSEMPIEPAPKPPAPSHEIEDKIKKLEFQMMILVCLTLIVMVLVIR
jgi:hypothetical protein